MKNYEMYNFETEQLVTYLGILHIEENTTDKELESIVDNFIKTKFNNIYEECLEIIMINTETQLMDYCFSLLTNHGEIEGFNDPWPYLHSVDIMCGNLFLNAYYSTYGKHLESYDY